MIANIRNLFETFLIGLFREIAQETAKAVADIRQEAQQFKAKKVASSIIARQEQTAKLIKQHQAIMEVYFDQLAAAKDSNSRNAALDKISSQMTAWEPKKLQRDFKELPWGRPDSKVPAPVTTQDFNKLAPALEHYQVKNDKITINPKYKPLVDASTQSPDQLWKQATPTVFTSTSVGQWQKISFNGMMLNDQNKWPVLASLPVATQPEDLNIEDSWVPQDASYKRYERTKGIDLAKAVPFDAEDFLNKAKQGATVDETNGSVQNLNAANIETATKVYQDKVEAYLKQQHPTATVGDVLGTSKIKTYKSKMLSPVLPYEVVAVVRDYHTLPNTMRHYFHLNVYDAADPYASQMGSYAVQFKIPSTQLRGKPLALSFRPSTDADAQAIVNALPKPDASGNIDPSKLPKSLSSSIRVTGEITLDGQVLKTLPSYNLGTDIQAKMGFMSPNNSWSLPNKQFSAGEYHAIGYNMQGIGKPQMERLKAKLETAKTKIESKDEAQIQTLNGHDTTGAMLQAVVQGYFGLNDTQDEILERRLGVVSNSFMSFGTYSTSLQGVYNWGVLRTVKFSGMVMDIDRIGATIVDKDNNKANLLSFSQQQGPRQSLNENLVPEKFFNDPNSVQKNVEGVSATKILKLANDQGQKIYQIDQSNINTILPKLNHDSQVITDIRNAVAAGKVVTTSEKSINFNGWSGSGYIILDPNTGSGAYMISGGLNGGIAFGLGLATSSIIAAIIAGLFGLGGVSFGVAATAPFLLGLFVPLLIFFFMLIAVILYANIDDEEFISCFTGGFAMNVVGFVGFLWSKIAYLLGFAAGASVIGTAGGCYGY